MKKPRIIISFILAFVLLCSSPLYVVALFGDLNNDDCVGIADAIVALRFVTGIQTPTQEQEQSADLDYDGVITTNDVRLIMRGAANIDYVPDHLFSQWETISEPTCTEDGLAKCYCLYCSKEVHKVLKKKGHTIVPATCEKEGYCSVCFEILSEPKGHTENDGYCSDCNVLISLPYLTYNGIELAFGCTPASAKVALGEPKVKYTDSYAEKTVEIHVYYTDYTDLGIFTFTDGKLTQFFTNTPSSSISQGSTVYSLNSETVPEKIGDIVLTTYKDKFKNNSIYSFCAKFGDNYNLKKTTDYTINAKLNLHLTNGLRAINGVSELKYCADASAVATAHSTDMATRNFFDHTNPDGKKVGARLTAGGVEWFSCAENIVAGVYDPYTIANGWYNSEGHRANILNSKYKYLGIGFAYSEKSDYKYYGTQNFYTDEY